VNRQALDTLATLLDPASGWSDIVTGHAVGRELQVLQQRCLERERLREQAGAGVTRTLNRGVRALFSGPSGTGKTLAARALAAELGKDLYRVDLAAVVNKYIGETERNINLVLTRAEELDVVLLLDEGDALMTNRTDVRNSTDRYANLETNYLLQRLESYEGIILVTTNAGKRIDEAFLRRLDAVIEFAPPDAPDRWLIWQAHLPAGHGVSAHFLEEVATRCPLSGGQIRNAALHATLLSLGAAGPLDDTHLEMAVQREFRKAGASYPLRARAPRPDQMDRLARLAADLT
jgi:SpoVK/Ycf46/Vps4 family AAA+-type ATPase